MNDHLARLCSGITDGNLGQLMRISIKGPALPAVDFSEVLTLIHAKVTLNFFFLLGGGGDNFVWGVF